MMKSQKFFAEREPSSAAWGKQRVHVSTAGQRCHVTKQEDKQVAGVGKVSHSSTMTCESWSYEGWLPWKLVQLQRRRPVLRLIGRQFHPVSFEVKPNQKLPSEG